MKRFIAAAFALIGLALSTGALAAPTADASAAHPAEDRAVVAHGSNGEHGPEGVSFHPPTGCVDGYYHCDGTPTSLICECDEELEEE